MSPVLEEGEQPQHLDTAQKVNLRGVSVDGNGKSNVNPQNGEPIICRDQLLWMAIDLTLEFLADLYGEACERIEVSNF